MLLFHKLIKRGDYWVSPLMVCWVHPMHYHWHPSHYHCNQTFIWHVVLPGFACLSASPLVACICAPSSNKFLQLCWVCSLLSAVCSLLPRCCWSFVMLFRKVKLHICFYYNKCQFSCLQFNYVSTVKISLLVFAFSVLSLLLLLLYCCCAKRAIPESQLGS